MVNFPLVVLNCTLNVSGALAVSLAGSGKPCESDAVFAVRLVFCALATPRAANRPSAQSNVMVFMAGQSSMGTAKSHARNHFLFIDLVIRLLPREVRERINPRRMRSAATLNNIAPVFRAPWRLKPEFSAPAALVEVPAI